MKNFIYFLLILSLIIISCKGDEPTSPENETSNSEALAEANIGAEGGTLKTEDFEVSIPPGTFISSNEIVIEEEVDSAYTESNVTPTFRIDGIPRSFTNKIKIALKHNGNLSNENYIAIGEKVACKSLSKEITSYIFLEAKDSSGYLVANLTTPNTSSASSNYLSKKSNVWQWIKVVGVSNIIALENTEGHFRFIYEAETVEPLEFANLSVGFENAYSVFLNKGFNYDRRNKWPISVIVKNIESEPGYITWGYYTGSSFLEDYGFIVINLETLKNEEKLKVVIGHEFLHLVQDLYNPRTREQKRTSHGRQYWLDEATAAYSEIFFNSDPDYYSSSFLISPTAPFNGFHLEGKPAGNHGYGMSTLIKYLNNRFLSSSLINYYRDIELGKHPVEAIIFNSNESTDWVHHYFQELIEGKIYNIHPIYWVDNVPTEKTYIIDSRDDTLKNYNDSYQDLSGGLFNIKMQYKEWKDNTKIYFTLVGEENQNSELSVFKYKEPSSFEHLYSDITKVIVPDLEELAAEDWNFLGLVSNRQAISPFTNKTNINLQIDIKEPKDVMKDYKTAYIDVHIKGFHIRTTADSSYEDPYYEFYETYSPGGQNGNLSGNTFTSSWSDSREEDYPEEGTMVTWNGSINIVFSEDFQEIISYTETNAENWPGWRTTNMSVSVKNIPFNYGDEWSGDEFLLDSGEETCNHVVSRSYNTTWWDGKSFVFSRNECDESSYISIKLYED